MHLLTECTYSQKVYNLLGIDYNDLEEVVGIGLNKSRLEIRCDILNYLVFRQHTMPPEILVRTTLEKFKNGLVNRIGVKKVAEQTMRRIFRE